MILAGALFVGCTNDDLVNEGLINDGQGVKVTASIAKSRTTFEEGDGIVKTLWEANDAIGLFHNGAGARSASEQSNLKYAAKEAGAITTFTAEGTNVLEAEDGTTVYAYYPYVNATQVTVPQNYTQKWVSNDKAYSYDENTQEITPLDFVYTKGTVSNGALALNNFKHRYAFIKLTVSKKVLHYTGTTSGTPTNYKIEVCSSNNIPIGTWTKATFDATEEKFQTLELWTHSTYNVYCYIPSKEFEKDHSQVTCYIAVLPTDAAGETLSFYKRQATKDNSTLMDKKIIPEGGLKAGEVYSFTLGDVATEE